MRCDIAGNFRQPSGYDLIPRRCMPSYPSRRGDEEHGSETEQYCARGVPFERTRENEVVPQGRLWLEIRGRPADELLDVPATKRTWRRTPAGGEPARGGYRLRPHGGHRDHAAQ